MRCSSTVVAVVAAALLLLVSCASPSVTGPCTVESDSSITLDVDFQIVTSFVPPVPPSSALSEQMATLATTVNGLRTRRPVQVRANAAGDTVTIGIEVPVTWTVDVYSASVNEVAVTAADSAGAPYCDTFLPEPRAGYHRRFFTITPAAPFAESDIGNLEVTYTTGTIADGVYYPAVYFAYEPDVEEDCVPSTAFHRVTKGSFAFVNFDLTSSFNADVVLNGTDDTQDTLMQITSASETATLVFATESVVGLAGLPDDGLLTAARVAEQYAELVADLPECLPDIQLGFSNDSDGNNAWLQEVEADALTIDVPDAQYAELLLYVTPPMDLVSGPQGFIRAMRVEMTYDDTSSTEVATILPILGLPFSMPPMAADAPDLVPSFEMAGGVLVDTSETDSIPLIPAGIVAMLVSPDSSKTLTSVRITPFESELTGFPADTSAAVRTHALEPVKLAVFGAAGLQLQPNLAVEKTLLTGGPYLAGNDVTYRITVTNDGTGDSSGVTVTDALTPELAFVSAIASDGTCDVTGGTVTCDLGTIAAGTAETVEVIATIVIGGEFRNTAAAAMSGGEADTSDNEGTVAAVAIGEPNLVVDKTVLTPGPYEAGDVVTYRITVTNDGTDASGTVTVTDALPSGTDFIGASASDGTCSEAGDTVTCQLGVLAVAASETIDIDVRLMQAGTIVNTAEATMTGGEADPSDNADDATITVGAATLADVPTLSQWGVILLGALLAFVALLRMRD